MRNTTCTGIVAAVAITAGLAGCVSTGWQGKLNGDLRLFGHRNWIVVVDSAYPAQTAAGTETVATGEDQLDAVKKVLQAVDSARHVRPVIYLDAELPHVSEADAPGISAYRKKLTELLAKRTVKSVPHEELIAKLDTAAKTFRVLILKTNLTLPYTSVFLELDCGYWSTEAQQRLRDAMRATN